MADVDIDPFGEHESRPEEPMNEYISLHLVTPVGGRSTWEPERGEQETSFGGESQRTKLLKNDDERLYQKLSKRYQLPEERHFDMFEIRNKELYYKGVDKPLTYKKGKLRSVKEIEKRLGEERLHYFGFEDKVTAEQAVILNKAEEELPSASDVDKADDIELQEIVENASRSIENLNQQVPSEDLPM